MIGTSIMCLCSLPHVPLVQITDYPILPEGYGYLPNETNIGIK